MSAFEILASPLGPLFIEVAEAGVQRVKFLGAEGDASGAAAALERDSGEAAGRGGGAALLARAVEQMRAYLGGRRAAFDLPLAPRGTVFQRAVWEALLTIPAGEVVTYGAIAEAVGRPGAARAVGQAVGRNPLAIVVPCHRVLAAGGAIGGYAAGLERKRWLLEHEARLRPRAARVPA